MSGLSRHIERYNEDREEMCVCEENSKFSRCVQTLLCFGSLFLQSRAFVFGNTLSSIDSNVMTKNCFLKPILWLSE